MSRSGIHCVETQSLVSFDTRCQSLNGPTPGDYKFQNPIEHTFIDWRIIKEVV